MLTPLVLSLLVVTGKQDAGLPHNTFDRGTEGWSVGQMSGSGAKVEAIYDKPHLKASPGSLDYSYKVGSGEASLAALSVGVGKLAKMNSIHFWMQADHATTVVVTLQEKDGGRYSAACHAGKNVWQEVQLSLSDFALGTEPDAPKDPDGKLDPDQVESVAIIDAEMFLAQNQSISDLLGVTSGPRNLFISDFQFSDVKVPDSFALGADGYKIDTYTRPQESWIGFGISQMSVATDSPFTGKWLKLDYHVNPGHVNGTVRALKMGALAGKKNLVFEVGAAKDSLLIVQIEQVNGAKFNSTIDVPGMAHSKAFSLPISDMKISDDSPDKGAKLDLSQVKQMVILDIAGFTSSSDQDNTLWIGPITAKA